MSASGGAAVVAHGVHYAIVGVGLVALVALLTPRFLVRTHAPRDTHEVRVVALRKALATPPHLGNRPVPGPPLPGPPLPSSAAVGAPATTASQSVLLPVAVVSAAAAAGVHAAVGPPHLRGAALTGLFFVTCALLQLLWAGAVASRCTRRLLVAGAVGNAAVVGLWALSRTTALPLGLVPRPEPFGPWDLTCAAWELAAVCCCLAMLRAPGGPPDRLADWRSWHVALPPYVAASALALVALSLSGAGS